MATKSIKIMDLWRLLKGKPKRAAIGRRATVGGSYDALPLAEEPLPKLVRLTQPVRVLVRRSVELSTMQQYKVVGSIGADRLLLSVGRDVVEVSRAAVKVLQ